MVGWKHNSFALFDSVFVLAQLTDQNCCYSKVRLHSRPRHACQTPGRCYSTSLHCIYAGELTMHPEWRSDSQPGLIATPHSWDSFHIFTIFFDRHSQKNGSIFTSVDNRLSSPSKLSLPTRLGQLPHLHHLF